MRSSNHPALRPATALLKDGQSLSSDLMAAAIEALTSGDVHEGDAGEFLLALRAKGENAEEIGAAATVLRKRMVRLQRPPGVVLDTCGTGGDDSGTFNISTATALVVAATGCAVVKHGNRSVSSRSGSADVLAALGVNVEGGPAWSQRCLERLGFAFCFAPHFHPTLAAVAPVRRQLGVRTIFNLLGPLLNPGSAEYQLLGVGKPELLDPLAGAVSRLGVRRAFLVCSADGLDEVSLSAATMVRHVRGNTVESLDWAPEQFGLLSCRLEDLRAEGPAESARMIEGVLAGDAGPARRIVLANAAAALLAAERVTALPEGVGVAENAIDSGSSIRLLEALRTS